MCNVPKQEAIPMTLPSTATTSTTTTTTSRFVACVWTLS